MINDKHGVPFMTRGAAYAVMLLGLFAVGLAAFNVYLWNDSRTTRADLKAERAARLTQRQQDQRAAKIARVTQCRQSIPAIARANHVIDDLRTDELSRARQARDLALADPTAKLRRVHLEIAARQEKRAAELQDFPAVTPKQCDALAAKLFGPYWKKVVPRTTTTTGGSQ